MEAVQGSTGKALRALVERAGKQEVAVRSVE
jgi:hypothetical protein